MDRRKGSAYERTFLGIAITVTAVWAIVTLAQVFLPGHPQAPESVNLSMGTVAAAFFGGALISSRRRNIADNAKRLRDDEDDDEDDDFRDPDGTVYKAGGRK